MDNITKPSATSYKPGDMVMVNYPDLGPNFQEVGKIISVNGPLVDVLVLSKGDPLGDSEPGDFILHTAATDPDSLAASSFITPLT